MFVESLSCFRCGETVPASPGAYLCPRCGAGAPGDDPGVLDVRYRYAEAGAALRQRLADAPARTDVFRWAPLLPVEADDAALAAGGTPLVAAPGLARRLGMRALWLKDEGGNPTRCLKDRATAVGVAMARASGARTMYCASAGNAAISLAGFCASAGIECHVFVPSGVAPERLMALRDYGAQVRVSGGNYDQAFAESEEAGRGEGWYSRNCAFNPFLVEGKKTVAFEIAEQLGWSTPDLVVAPVGDGCTLGATGKGFRELREVGLAGGIPRLVGVQSAAVRPLVTRFGGTGPDEPAGETRARSIAVRRPRNALRLRGELAASGGVMVAVTDAEMRAAQLVLREETGIAAELTSAATLAGLLRLADREPQADRTAVLIITSGRVDADA